MKRMRAVPLVAATPLVAWLTIIFFAFSLPAMCNDAIGKLALFTAGAKDVAIPFYSTNTGKCIAVLRAERLYQDYQRSGFFRIGALPMLAIENLRLEVRDVTQLSAGLSAATAALDPRTDTKRVVDGRQFSIVFAANTDVSVRARRMRLDTPIRWRLEDVSIISPESRLRTFRHAMLHMGGRHAGELIAETRGGAVTISLSDLAALRPQPKQTQ